MVSVPQANKSSGDFILSCMASRFWARHSSQNWIIVIYFLATMI